MASLSFFSYCLTAMSPSSALHQTLFSPKLFVLSSLRRLCRRPLPPKPPHLYPCLCWESPPYLPLQVKYNITQGFHECFSAPLCVFCFLSQFSGIVYLGFKQCLRALAPKSNQMSQDFVHPSNHCITTWLQLTPSQLATSGLVSVEHPMGAGHVFLPCHLDLRKVRVGTKGD